MTYKQEPCPLCGRDMTAIETHPGRGELYCGHCDLIIGGNDAKTPEELIALMDSSEHRRLKAENARLRDLVRDMWRNMHGCTFHHSCGSCDFDECIYDKRVREMGIEVADA